MNGLNNELKRIASELLIKTNYLASYNINRSLDILLEKLENYFGDELHQTMLFGSYSRKTMLPKTYDPYADIDILVQFNMDKYKMLQPESYRNQLRKFSEREYPKAIVLKDHPCIVLELSHIKFDLVPSYFKRGFLYDSIQIPNKSNGWMETNPNKFNQKVMNANKEYNSIVKPIIRLFKYWNASNSYPYSSYELERSIIEMDFTGDNYQSGFIYAAQGLSSSGFPNWAKDSVNKLKANAVAMQTHLKHNEVLLAKKFLSNILPGF